MRLDARDFRTLAIASALPAFIAAIFPYSAVGYRPAPAPARPRGVLAFADLSDAAARLKIRAARSSWQIETSSAALRQRPDLSSAELPAESWRSVLTVAERTPPPAPALTVPDFPPFRPSLAAPAAPRLVAEPMEPTPAFSRANLLAPADFNAL